MAIARRYYERRALADALGTQLNATGWGVGQIRQGYQTEEDITVPLVSLFFLPSKYIEMQMGRKLDTEKSFSRRLQIDCYMETEPRADMIGDEVADFLDEFFINIKDPNGNVLGVLYTEDSETISAETLPPLYRDAKVKRWRCVVMATLRADYF